MAEEVGSIFWNLQIFMQYIVDTDINCIIYANNPTDVDRDYMLMVRVTSGDTVLNEYPVIIDKKSWFTVNALGSASLYGALTVGYSDAVLNLDLYEKVSNDVVDSIAVVLVKPVTLPSLPTLPEIPYAAAPALDLASLMGMMMLIVMMTMIVRSVGSGEKA